MPLLPREYIGARCEIKSLANDLLAVGRIARMDGDALEVAARSGEKMPLLPYRSAAKLVITHLSNNPRILAGKVYLCTDKFARFEEVKPLQSYERRGAFRQNTSVEGQLTALPGPEGQAAPEETAPFGKAGDAPDAPVFDVQLQDISLTGVRLRSAAPLQFDARYELHFTLFKTPISLELQLVRTIALPRGETQYGCAFCDYSQRKADILCGELFELQRIEIRRRRS